MKRKIIIFTDLDGSILDKNTHSLNSILPFFKRVVDSSIVIFNSSKTFLEIHKLSTELNLKFPFIVENGSAIIIPKSSSLILPKERNIMDNNYKKIKLGTTIKEISEFINSEVAYKFIKNCRFLNSMNNNEIMALTNLSEESIINSKKREYSFPFLWNGGQKCYEEFKQLAQSKNYLIVRGGQFYHISGNVNKGKAMDILINIYLNHMKDTKLISVAIGDSDNDLEMLNKANYAGIIKSGRKNQLKLEKNKNVYYSKYIAPLGWQEVLNNMSLFKLKK
tara:strand:- start:460 stop:1293 length:834 start_codon:yes stop_codon:yes gene_type:complete